MLDRASSSIPRLHTMHLQNQRCQGACERWVGLDQGFGSEGGAKKESNPIALTERHTTRQKSRARSPTPTQTQMYARILLPRASALSLSVCASNNLQTASSAKHQQQRNAKQQASVGGGGTIHTEPWARRAGGNETWVMVK